LVPNHLDPLLSTAKQLHFNTTMKFTNQLVKISVLASMCLLSYVLKIDAFSSSPVVSAFLRSYSSSTTSVLYQQILDVDDDENNATGEQQQPTRPFFFTGEPKSEAENKELRRVFLGLESLRSSADDTIENEAAAYTEDANGTFLKGTISEEEGASGFAINFDQERENLERLFRM